MIPCTVSFADHGRWPPLTAPYAHVLGPLSPTTPLFGGRDARVGHFHGLPVWLVWVTSMNGSETHMWLAMSIGGHPIHGTISTDVALRDLPPIADAAFFHHFELRMNPPEVAARALDDPDTRARVQRIFRGGGGARLVATDGHLRTSADFHNATVLGPNTGPRRPPTLEEASTLIADLAHIAQRLSAAYDERLTTIAQAHGAAAAQTWDAQCRTQQQAEQQRRRKVLRVIYLGGAVVVLIIILSSLTFAVKMMRWTGF